MVSVPVPKVSHGPHGLNDLNDCIFCILNAMEEKIFARVHLT